MFFKLRNKRDYFDTVCFRVGIFLFVIVNILFLEKIDAEIIGVNPTRLYLSSQQPIGMLTLSNPGKAYLLMQVSVFRWKQVLDRMFYSPTQEILFTPPIFSIPPHGKQIIRLMMKQNQTVNQLFERDYRVFIREIIPFSLKHSAPHDQLKMVLSLNLPLFYLPAIAHSRSQWAVHWLNRQKIDLSVKNIGNVTLLINQWKLFSHDQELAQQDGLYYLQPGQENHWIVLFKQQAAPTRTVPMGVSVDIDGQKTIHAVHVF